MKNLTDAIKGLSSIGQGDLLVENYQKPSEGLAKSLGFYKQYVSSGCTNKNALSTALKFVYGHNSSLFVDGYAHHNLSDLTIFRTHLSSAINPNINFDFDIKIAKEAYRLLVRELSNHLEYEPTINSELNAFVDSVGNELVQAENLINSQEG